MRAHRNVTGEIYVSLTSREQLKIKVYTEIHLPWKYMQEYSQNIFDREDKSTLPSLLHLPLSTSPSLPCSGENEIIFSTMCRDVTVVLSQQGAGCWWKPALGRDQVVPQLHSLHYLSHQVLHCSWRENSLVYLSFSLDLFHSSQIERTWREVKSRKGK